MTPLEAVQRCVSRDESRYELTKPLRFTVAGRTYLAGTNGHLALMIPDPPLSEFECAVPARARTVETLGELLSDACRPTAEVRLARLVEWTGPGEYETCNRCEGTGEVDHVCDCGDEHRAECPDCYKGKRQGGRGFGRVLGQKFNRWLIARAVGHATDERIRLGVFPAPGGRPNQLPEEYGCLVLEGNGWRAAVMGASADRDEQLPVFELEAPAEVRP